MFTQVGTLRNRGIHATEGSLASMTGKISRGLVCGAAVAAAAVVLTACGDSSTASAPLTQDVTTTTMRSAADGSSTAASSAESTTVSEEETKAAEEAASQATTTLPATKPDKSTPVPGNFPGSGQGQQELTDKDKAYLAALKRDKVSFMGDDDNNVALTWGHYVCQEKRKKTDPMMIKVYVRAGIGPMTKSEDEAGVKADKLIAAAEKNLC